MCLDVAVRLEGWAGISVRHLSSCSLHPRMLRSLNTQMRLAALSLALSVTSAIAQTTSPAPKQGSRVPQPPATAAPGGSTKPAANDPGALAPEPQQPKTEILDSSATSGALATDGHDPILDPPPAPTGPTTLVGGMIRDVDQIRNRIVVDVFGGGRWTISFDERTHVFRNGAATTQLALKKGERVYVDTMLDNNQHDIFARNIRVGATTVPADADGQVISVNGKRGELVLRDNINSEPVRFAVDKNTRVVRGLESLNVNQIQKGSLIHVQFAPERPNRGLAREIKIIAVPGSAFTFAGKITYLDLHRGVLALQNDTDGKSYDIHFDPKAIPDARQLGVGVPVKVVTTFDGSNYIAQTVESLNAQQEK